MVSRRGLQVVLAVLGMVAVASGLYGMLAGPAALPGAGPVDATVDSEFRFTNAFWWGSRSGLKKGLRELVALRAQTGAPFGL